MPQASSLWLVIQALLLASLSWDDNFVTPRKIVGTVATFLCVCTKCRTEHDGNVDV